jgi:hypothetical protein
MMLSAGIINDAPAPSFITIDDFEDSDLSEYTGSTGEFSFVSGIADGSSTALRCDSGGFSEIYSTSGLNAYFGKGEIAQFEVQFNDTSQAGGLVFGYSDDSNFYRCWFDLNSDALQLLTDTGSGGSGTVVAEATSVGFAADTRYRVRIPWDDGTLGGADNDITLDMDEWTGSAWSDFAEVSGNNDDHASATGVGIEDDCDSVAVAIIFDDIKKEA